MKNVPAHSIERSFLEQKAGSTRKYLDELFDQLPERADLLSIYAKTAIEYAAVVTALHKGDDPVAWLRRAARAYALMFVKLEHPSEGSAIELDDDTTLTVPGSADADRAAAPHWIEAMWCALAVDDPIAQHWLTTVDTDALRPQGVLFNDYVFDYAKFLRSIVQRDASHSQWLGAAIEHCEPSSPQLEETRDWIDHFDYPALRTSYQLLVGDAAKFNEALEDLLQNHRAYWSASSHSRALQGLLSLPASALRRLADAQELEVEVESPYMPAQVWQAPAPERVLTCPYCVGPKPASAAHCALCGRDTSKDAAMELTTGKFRAQQTKSCTSCGFRVHTLANTCPRCRKRQS
jgi:hypothetical protein